MRSRNQGSIRPTAHRLDDLDLLVVALMEHEKELSGLIEKLEKRMVRQIA